MKILIELTSFDKGGLEKVVLDQAIILKKQGYDLVIVSVKKIGLLGIKAKNNDIEVIDLSDSEEPEIKYQDILIKKRIDLVISHFSRFGYELCFNNNIRNISYIHNVYAFLNGIALEDFKNDDKYVYHYISVSDNATQYAIKKLGINKAKISTIPNGLNLDELKRSENLFKPYNLDEFGLKTTDFTLINVASYNLHKAHYLMLDAMKKVVKINSNIKIICVGNIVLQEHFNKLIEDVENAGLSQNILFPGYYEDLYRVYPLVDAFLLPSFIEGWSIAMMEAMYFEKPMILSNTGGAKDVINGDDIGILLENEYGDITNLDPQLLDKLAYEIKSFRTSENLATAILDFYNNQELWKKKGHMGKKKICDFYTIDQTVNKLSSLLKELE